MFAAGLRVLVLGGVETRFHAFEEVTPALAEAVRAAGHLATIARAPDGLEASRLRGFDAVASITTGGSLDAGQEAALLAAIREGRNDRGRPLDFLGIHGAACSFDGSAGYYEMLGGRFLRHPPMCRFAVDIDAPDHPITRGVSRFETYDECYVLETRPDVEVLISAASPEPRDDENPARLVLGWVKRYGAGRVVYLAPGHGQEQLENPGLRALVSGALGWFSASPPG